MIDDLLDRALRAEASALVVRGQAGIGKTAVLDHAAARSRTWLTLRATGIEAEADLAFAGLYGLARPIFDKLDVLPAMQRTALGGALGLGPSSDPDRLLVSAALLGLLAAAAEDHPVLCIIDDAQWLDRPSADALIFAARRLRAERLAMLFGARDGDSLHFQATGLQELVIEPLDEQAAAALVSQRVSTATATVRDRVLSEAAGNPLALLELPSALSEEQLSGEDALPETMSLTPRLQSVFHERIERLPEPTRTALRIAGAEDTGEVAPVLSAMTHAGLPPAALDAAERSDLIQIADGKISFRHPLVRSALRDGATLNELRLAHTALAEALVGEENVDRRVWHQAMATLGPNEEVAAALETSARRARARAAHSSAASALLRAAELSGDGQRQVRRITAAAQAAWDAGQPGRARAAISAALPRATNDLKARLLFLSGVIEARCGSLAAAVSQLLEGAELTSDPTLRLAMMREAGEVAGYQGRLQTVVELGTAAESIPVSSDRDRLNWAALTGFGFAYSGHHQEAQERLGEAVRAADALDDPHGLTMAAIAAAVAGDMGDGLPYIDRAAEAARRRGLLAELAGALEWQATELNYVGRFDHALASAREGYQLALDVGRGRIWHLTAMATAEAHLGHVDDARRHAEEAVAIGRRSGSTLLVGNAEWTLAFIDMTNGRLPDALERLLTLTSIERADSNPFIVLSSIPDAIEAAVRCGRPDAVRERLAMLEGWTQLAPTDQRRAMLARCRALLDVDHCTEWFREALGLADALTPIQRARTELLYGEWLRRERRRQEARSHLRAALELFRGMGARPFVQRTEAELRATGETARKRDPSTLDELTPQELQIATMVARGMTNKEIAAQLFLSPRTIDYHLHKVFSKLGIASRTVLIRDGLPARG